MTDNSTIHPELELALALLEKIDVPTSVECAYDVDGKTHYVTLERVGVNPAMTLQMIREWGVVGIKHSAPTCFFWKCSGAPAHVTEAFQQEHGDKLFDFVQQAMLSPQDGTPVTPRYH